jgi:hypothetical protein
MRPFWPRSGAIGVSTTIGAPQATQGLVRRASFIASAAKVQIGDLWIDAPFSAARTALESHNALQRAAFGAGALC